MSIINKYNMPNTVIDLINYSKFIKICNKRVRSIVNIEVEEGQTGDEIFYNITYINYDNKINRTSIHHSGLKFM